MRCRESVSFDEPNLVSHAGLVPVAELAQRLRVAERIDETVTVAGSVGANGGAEALTVIGAVLAGGDCINDVDLLRSGALPELFDRARPVEGGQLAAGAALGACPPTRRGGAGAVG